MPSRFVRPDTTTLHISGGDWLLVKKRLTAGEQRAAFARRHVALPDGRLSVDLAQIGVAQITAYLIDWSLVGLDGQIVAIRDKSIDDVTKALDALDAESFGEIRTAIETHEQAMAAERDQEKNVRDGEKNTSAISPSPFVVAGPLSGSAIST